MAKVDLAAIVARQEALEAENSKLRQLLSSKKSNGNGAVPMVTKADAKYPNAFFLNVPGKKPKFLYLEEAEWLAKNIADVRKVVG
jgi:hypothetical protein